MFLCVYFKALFTDDNVDTICYRNAVDGTLLELFADVSTFFVAFNFLSDSKRCMLIWNTFPLTLCEVSAPSRQQENNCHC